MHCDLLIEPRWLIPVVPEGVVLEDHAIAVLADQIVAIGPAATLRTQFQPKQHLRMPEQALMPGLINAHTHVAMSLMRGLADDLPLMQWLQDHIWPAEAKFVSAEFVADGVELAIAEQLRGGITAFADMYYHADVVAHTAARMGMRAVAASPIIEFPTAFAANANAYIDIAHQQALSFKDHPLVSVCFGPHAPYTVSDAAFSRIVRIAGDDQLRIYSHVHETETEVFESVQQYGVRPLQRLHKLGLLSPRFTAAHMTTLTDEEIALVVSTGMHIAHCPESNLKLASGFCPVEKLRRAGAALAFGTDGAASNNDLDMLGEMKTAALLAKAVAGDASALSAPQALSMATIGGARALGLADKIGSLEVGKQADMIALRFDELDALPVYHPISHIVYANHRRQVSDVWIAGVRRVQNGELIDVDMARIKANALMWGERIRLGAL
jgi:5-methylthioadenosine/S-adenosylhomocysteine deaminase